MESRPWSECPNTGTWVSSQDRRVRTAPGGHFLGLRACMRAGVVVRRSDAAPHDSAGKPLRMTVAFRTVATVKSDRRKENDARLRFDAHIPT
ncbi:hypothetical protein GCM10009844_00620 [Nocardioides koreensis]|uniref:Uncharacterized protein n=1 Tax=Nocardioides koreensis TaxID=433651 RepID=A0ABP5KSF3_9ACTN